MDDGETPGASTRSKTARKQQVSSPTIDAQLVLDALPIGLLIVQPTESGHWVAVASNRMFEQWAMLRTGALGLPLSMIGFLDQGDFLAVFAAFAGSPHEGEGEYRWSTGDPVRGRHFDVRFSRIADRGRIQISIRDCSSEVETENGLRREMLRDSLTGLPNRSAVAGILDEMLEDPDFGPSLTALVVADLDRFSRINDSLGHVAGDELLTKVADRLLSVLRDGDVLGRIDGDVFAIIVQLRDGPGDALHVTKRIQNALSSPFHMEERELTIRATIGIATPHGDISNGEDMIGNAEFAVTRAKHQGRRVEIYRPADATAARRRFTLESELRRAIERDELTLHYQPIIELKTGKVSSVEALARWNHPERGMISPVEFIPLAEETGLIVPLGRWALNTACTQLAEWRSLLPQAQRLQVSVNVSGIQLARDDVVDAVRQALVASRLPGEQLKIELTESAIIDNPERTTRVLEALKGLDAQIAMDDFGTGYSSLAYLQRLPIDMLKVDRSFVGSMLEEEDSFEIVNAIISLARSLMIETVAEGIERIEQSSRLRSLGCVHGQGFFFSRPIPAAEVPAYLASR